MEDDGGITVGYRENSISGKDKLVVYLNLVNKPGASEIKVQPCTQPIWAAPRVDMVNRLMISGQSGAGKSFFAAAWVTTMMEWDLEDGVEDLKDFFIFSRVPKDKKLDIIDGSQRITPEELVEKPVSVEDLRDSIVLFDDIDTIANKETRKAVQGLRDDVLETGRHEHVQTISINHLLTNGAETKKALSEATAAILFPRSGSKYHLKRYLREYAGFEGKMIRKIMDLPSRWVYISRTYPGYCVYESGAFMV
jgi:hypothetical protein